MNSSSSGTKDRKAGIIGMPIDREFTKEASEMRRQQNMFKVQKPNLWQYGVYEALALVIALIVLFLLPELGRWLQ
jgi:hypothetical protein